MPNKFVGHGPYHYAEGGHIRKELKFMADKGAPESMIKAEKKEHGLPFGKSKKFAEGGGVSEGPNAGIDDATRARAAEAVRARLARQEALAAGDTSAGDEPVPRVKAKSHAKKGPQIPKLGYAGMRAEAPTGAARPEPAAEYGMPMAKGGAVGFARGGSIDGCASRGKTRGKVV